ncbi:hypothetical protein [Microvirga terricola]|uniref:Uncharacterized protein n=1 Tax=Microvirga terricola TaxID=2719797 RepID=A0ABX0VDQ5_9HYPH|nr:hypothetical protein [Microvirga terricola]NIX77606.1 hypothetical protein [Microvirga terricola]
MASFLAAQAAMADGYQWHAVTFQKNRIEYGEPDGSDDRALMIVCHARKGVELIGSIPGNDYDFVEGGKIEVTVHAGALSERITGIVVELGNGLNFDITLPVDSPFLVHLGSGQPIGFSRADGGFEVPGRGGEGMIKGGVSACRK